MHLWNIIYIKLVSPIICVGHSTTKIYRKRLNPISLSVRFEIEGMIGDEIESLLETT
jgi:hypothetical protein